MISHLPIFHSLFALLFCCYCCFLYFILPWELPNHFLLLHCIYAINFLYTFCAHFNHIVWLIERQHVYHVMHFLKMKVFNFQYWQKVHRKLLMWKNKGNLKMRNLRSLIELFPPIINSFWIPFFSIDEH